MRWDILLIFVFALFILFFAGKFLLRGIKGLLILLFNTILGSAALYLLSVFGTPIGLTVVLNPFNALLTGLLGIPGLSLVILLNGIFA